MKTSQLPASFILILFMCFSPSQSEAQSSNQIRRGWSSVGLGVADSPPIALATNLTYQFGANLVSARGTIVGEYCIENCDYEESFWDLGLLYGRSTMRKWVQASIAFGPALTGRQDHHIDPIADEYTTIGLAGEMQLSAHLAFIGIGLYGFANINSRDSFIGLALILQIGKLQ